jgi:hypothetical protein
MPAVLPEVHMNIWNREGKKIGEVREAGEGLNVYDKNGQPAGRVNSLGTYDKYGRKISTAKDAGLALNNDEK